MNYRNINMLCYSISATTILVGVGIGLLAIWYGEYMDPDFTSKSLATTALLFVSSTLGALVTRLLVVEDPITKEKN